MAGDRFQVVAGIRDGDANPAGLQNGKIGKIIADGAGLPRFELKLSQNITKGRNLVAGALHDDAHSQFARAAFDRRRGPAGDDRDLPAALLPELQGRAVADME